MTSEPIARFLALYPKANDKVMQQLSKDFRNISDKDFRVAKDRIGLFKELAPLLREKLDKQTCQQILAAILDGEVVQAKEGLKGNNWIGSNQNYARPSFNPTTWAPGFRTVWKTLLGENDVEGVLNNLVRRATEAATQISDSQFLGQLEQDVEQHARRIPQFGLWAERAKHQAFEHLQVSIKRTVKKLVPTVHRVQEEECTERIKRESAKRADAELDKFRVDLIKHVNDSSSQTSYSCVFGSLLSVDQDPRLTFVGIRCS